MVVERADREEPEEPEDQEEEVLVWEQVEPEGQEFQGKEQMVEMAVAVHKVQVEEEERPKQVQIFLAQLEEKEETDTQAQYLGLPLYMVVEEEVEMEQTRQGLGELEELGVEEPEEQITEQQHQEQMGVAVVEEVHIITVILEPLEVKGLLLLDMLRQVLELVPVEP
jgi:hypothetical protein